MTPLKLAKMLLALSAALFVICLPFDAVCTNGGCAAWPAWSILAFGWISPNSLANVAWWANPVLFVSWALLFRRSAASLFWGGFAAVLVLLPLFSPTVVMNEGGVATRLQGFQLGYWLWVGAAEVNLIACIVSRTASKREKHSPFAAKS